MTRLATAIVTPLIAVLVFPLIVFAALSGKGSDCGEPMPAMHSTTTWDDEQRANASIIVKVGHQQGIPTWGQVIAVAVAIQESHLGNPPDGTDDSIGLFQQRPSQGWGSPHQLTSPAYQARQFYEALDAVPHWQTLPLTVAAQEVQKSATPDAYAQWTDEAIDLVLQNATEPYRPVATSDRELISGQCQDDQSDGLPDVSFTAPSQYALPADASPQAATAITWALQQLGTPYSYGGDCTDPHSGDPTRQCDCSSLVQQAYRVAGLQLPRTTTEQVHIGTVIPVSAIEPGDLVFIPGSEGTFSAPRHVGIYLGDGLIIHAPHTGARVRIAPLTTWDPIAAIRRVR